MKRAIIKFEDGEHCNLPADHIDADENMVSVFKDDALIGLFNISCVNAVYISEKSETKERR